MAFLQAIISLVGRSAGKIVTALFDWAVMALFGRMEGRRKIWLSALVGAAALWPILVLGVVAPRVAAFVVAFVPLSSTVSATTIRSLWIALAVLIPAAVGAALSLSARPGRPRLGLVRGIVRGVPVTLGLSAAFIILLLTVPVVRLASAVRGRQDVHLRLATTADSYARAAGLVAATLERQGFEVRLVEPPWWSAWPTRILASLGRDAFAGYVPEHTMYFHAGEIEVTLYPTGLLLRGPWSIPDARTPSSSRC